MKLFAIRWSRVGDVVLAISVLKKIKEKSPDFHITLLTDSHLQSLFEDDPLLDRVIYIDRNKLKNLNKMTASKNIIKYIFNIRKEKFDILLDFQGFFESALLSFFIKADKKIGFEGRGDIFYTIRVPKINVIRHDIIPFVKLLESAKISVEVKHTMDLPIGLHLSKKNRKFADGFMQTNKLEDITIIGINPGASASYKCAPEWLFAKVADQLFFDIGAKSIIFWGPGELDIAKNILNLMKSRGILAPKTNLGELAALSERCSLFITNDSGPMHIASAINVPVLAVFFKEHSNPKVSSPLGDSHRILYISKKEVNINENMFIKLAKEILR